MLGDTARRDAPPAALLVGREEEHGAAFRAARGAGCVIAGAAGIGKSRLATEVAHALTGRDGALVRVVATGSARSLPFGAFAHLASADPGSGDASIPELIHRIRQACPSGRPTLLVDDAHLLDEASAALVLAVATSRAATLLVTVRTPEPAPDAVVSLWKDAGAARVDLQPLALAEVRTLVEATLGGDVHELAHERIFELSQGNPLYVQELLVDGQRTGALGVRDGRWHWVADRLEFGRLRDIIGARSRHVTPAARHALELLAIGAPLDLDLVASLASLAAVEELESHWLVALNDDGARVEVELAHPLYGEVVAAETPALRRRRLLGELAGALASRGPRTDDATLRIATLRLDAGELGDEQSAAASALALRRGDPSLANRLAEAAGDGLEPALRLAQARIGLARFDDAEPILAPWEQAASEAPSDLAAAYLETRYRALLRGGGEGGAEALLDRAASWDDGPDWVALLATQRGWSALYDGRPAEAFAVVEPFVDEKELTPQRRFHVLAVAIYSLARLGRADDCEVVGAAIEDLLPLLRQAPWEVGFGRLMLDGIVRIQAGRDLHTVAARLEAAEVAASAAGDQALVGVIVHTRAGLALTRGRAGDAATLFGQALDLMSTADPLNSTGWTVTYLALARAMAGDAAGAERAIAEADRIVAGQPRIEARLHPDLERARAWVEVARGEHSAARARLVDLADACREDLLGEAEALYLALSLAEDPAACAERLEPLAEGCQNELVRLYARHARALADSDAAAQVEVAERFEALGLDLYAAEAAARAARSLRETGHTEPARRAAALARRGAARCEGAQTPALELVHDAPTLTNREREVATLAAKGNTNAQIAEVLVVSVRTVESHVLNACRKLGVANRRDLATALDASP